MTYSFNVGKPLSDDLLQKQKASGGSSMLDLTSQLFITVLNEPQPSEVRAFQGDAKLMVKGCNHIMIASLDFKLFTMDFVWSPITAQRCGEPMVEDPAGQHMLFHFVLCDEQGIVYGIRSATISPECGADIFETSHCLRNQSHPAGSDMNEMMRIFAEYPRGIPKSFFSTLCELGD